MKEPLKGKHGEIKDATIVRTTVTGDYTAEEVYIKHLRRKNGEF